mmetsp:Transcript_22779/g.34523  ORF Transcript_22779/g.34523 Transcript_22779/m.34523 type:complete len:93 (-) Transcript_22779:119-397(-)
MKVCADMNASVQQIAMDGIHPLPPAALPAARVSSPAPATLLARLNTDVAKDASPCSVAVALTTSVFAPPLKDSRGFDNSSWSGDCRILNANT